MAIKKTTSKTKPIIPNSPLPISRRPQSNSEMPQQYIDSLNEDLIRARGTLEEYAAHLRALDRKRLNKVGIKKRGFIDRALALAEENPEILPRYLTVEKFRKDAQYFVSLHSLKDLAQQIQELLRNITAQAGDVAYTGALEFYAIVQEAADRRVDGTETLYREMEPFFKPLGTRKKDGGAVPTKKKSKRDAIALLDGKRDGRIVIENVSPKAVGGKHIVIDEQFDGTEGKLTVNSEQ